MKSILPGIPKTSAHSILMFTATVMLAMLVLVLPLARGSGQQRKDRAVKIKTFKDQPIEIFAVKVKGALVEPERKLAGDSDWLNGMTVTIKNVSNKPVVYVTVSVAAHYEKDGVRKQTSDGREYIAAVDLMYGVPPHLPGQPPRSYLAAPLMPGQTADLLLSEINRDELYGLLRLEDASTDIPELTLWVNHVAWYGDDKTMWVRERMLRRDPNDARHWMPIDDPAPPLPRLNHASRKPDIKL